MPAIPLGMQGQGQTILCATDFSPSSGEALEWATALARRWKASVDLIHVLPAPSSDPEALATDVRVVESVMLASATDRIETVARQADRQSGVAVRGRVVHGDPPQAIADAARATGAALIVVGSHGRSAVGRWLLGSVADRTVRAADRPVAVIPPPGARSDYTLPPAANGIRWRVVAGLDLGPASERVVRFISDLQRGSPFEVTFLHFYWPPEQLERLGLQGPRNLLEPDPDVVANLEPRLRERVGILAADSHVKWAVRPAWGEPAGNVLAAAHEARADLIVVAAEERHGLSRLIHPSVAGALATHARQVPVICLPAPAAPVQARGPSETPVLLTVLAPTDLSAPGNRAVAYAYTLLRAQGGVVELCHVHERTLPTPAFAYEETRGRLSPDQRAALEGQLRKLVPSDAERFGITTHVSVIDGGEAAPAILQAAERLNVDAISMGSQGRSGVARALLGSVAEQVTRSARKPVLIVRAAD